MVLEISLFLDLLQVLLGHADDMRKCRKSKYSSANVQQVEGNTVFLYTTIVLKNNANFGWEDKTQNAAKTDETDWLDL